MKIPHLETIVELEDDIRRTRQQLKVHLWTHEQLLSQAKKDPEMRRHRLVLARLKFRTKKLLAPLALWVINW